MKLMQKIKAFFRINGQGAELEVSSAEIKQGKVFLHPANDSARTVCIRTQAVDIIINPSSELQEDDIEIFDTPTKKTPPTVEAPEPPRPRITNAASNVTSQQHNAPDTLLPNYMPQMKRVSFSLYPDEYEMLMSQLKNNGYRKTEFLLACISAAKKNSMEATYRKYTAEHKERRKAGRDAAILAQEQARREKISRQEQNATMPS